MEINQDSKYTTTSRNRNKNIGISILTADCAPIFFFDPKSTIVAAAHAGWKGALLGITDNTVKAMEKIGAERQNIIACIGPITANTATENGLDVHVVAKVSTISGLISEILDYIRE